MLFSSHAVFAFCFNVSKNSANKSTAIISLLIFAWRSYSILPSDIEKVRGISKESALVVTQFLLLSFASIIMVGTLFPIVSEAISGQKISIQAPYFNAFAPYFGVAIVVMIAIGNLMHFNRSGFEKRKQVILGSCLIAIPVTALLFVFGDVDGMTRGMKAYVSQVVGIYLVSWLDSFKLYSCLLLTPILFFPLQLSRSALILASYE